MPSIAKGANAYTIGGNNRLQLDQEIFAVSAGFNKTKMTHIISWANKL